MSTKPELHVARDALRRIYSAANGIVIGEEPPRETGLEIQRMCLNGLKGRQVWPWSHKPFPIYRDKVR
jgi:hypothetical protein